LATQVFVGDTTNKSALQALAARRRKLCQLVLLGAAQRGKLWNMVKLLPPWRGKSGKHVKDPPARRGKLWYLL